MKIDDLNILFDISDSSLNIVLDDILAIKNDNDNDNEKKNSDKIIVNENIFTDTKINEWAKSIPSTKGGIKIFEKILKTPINNKELLLKRQNTNYELLGYQYDILKANEKDILWIMTLDKEINEDISIKLLYPSGYIINNLNYFNHILLIYHLYKIIILPLMCIGYPITIFYTPFYYLNYYMKFNITFTKYISLIYEVIKICFKFSGNLKADLMKILTVFIYISIYIYSIYQTFYISYIIYKTREKLLNKLNGLYNFIKTAIIIIKQSNNIWKPFFIYNTLNDDILNNSINNLDKLENNLSTVYKLWKHDNYKTDIINILKIIYTIDIIDALTKLKQNENWCIPTYDNTITQIWAINNPLLTCEQISNPVNLSKNIIITGVNAGGKTTYVKSITINIILAQTIGIINAIKGNIYLYDAITSLMRVSDELGYKSYFEAETSVCNEMIKIAEDLNKNGKRGLILMDEPMHSTPPIEGIAVAYSVAEYLAKLQGITLILTTHFHNLIELETKHESLFRNLSVNADYEKETNSYKFNYKIRRGPTRQIIAIELLEKNKFNNEVILSAIEMKNKIYNENLRNVSI